MTERGPLEYWLTDMDGVLVHEGRPVPGAEEFLRALSASGKRTALNVVGGHSERTAMIGDRMDTDVVAGVEAGLETILVLSGVTREEEVDRFPFRPSRVVPSIADVIALVDA